LRQRLPSKAELQQKWFNDLKLATNQYLNKREKSELLDLLHKYQDVISQGPADIGKYALVQSHIPVEEGKTVKATCRPLPSNLKQNFK